MRLANRDLLAMAEARARHADFDVTRSWTLPADAPAAHDDEDFAAYLTRCGFTPAQLEYTRRAWGNAAADDIGRISAAAARLAQCDTTAGEGDYRIVEGYDRLIAHLATGLDIRTGAIVTAIAWSDAGVHVTCADGAVYRADRAIVTLPLGVLQANSVVFDPPLPDAHRDAIAALTMGAGAKLVYRFDQPVLPEGIAALYSAGSPPMWWSSSVGRADRRDESQMITAFVTGDRWRALAADGDDAALAAGLRLLRAELDRALPDPTTARVVDWTRDPFARGVYSVTPPGALAARGVLAQAVGDRLFFAGEATAHEAWSATVHGAYASGLRAATEVWRAH